MVQQDQLWFQDTLGILDDEILFSMRWLIFTIRDTEISLHPWPRRRWFKRHVSGRLSQCRGGSGGPIVWQLGTWLCSMRLKLVCLILVGVHMAQPTIKPGGCLRETCATRCEFSLWPYVLVSSSWQSPNLPESPIVAFLFTSIFAHDSNSPLLNPFFFAGQSRLVAGCTPCLVLKTQFLLIRLTRSLIVSVAICCNPSSCLLIELPCLLYSS
jgi:hypothetical protein